LGCSGDRYPRLKPQAPFLRAFGARGLVLRRWVSLPPPSRGRHAVAGDFNPWRRSGASNKTLALAPGARHRADAGLLPETVLFLEGHIAPVVGANKLLEMSDVLGHHDTTNRQRLGTRGAGVPRFPALAAFSPRYSAVLHGARGRCTAYIAVLHRAQRRCTTCLGQGSPCADALYPVHRGFAPCATPMYAGEPQVSAQRPGFHAGFRASTSC